MKGGCVCLAGRKMADFLAEVDAISRIKGPSVLAFLFLVTKFVTGIACVTGVAFSGDDGTVSQRRTKQFFSLRFSLAKLDITMIW